ncbi:hypothetical protein DXN05_17585 [Deminuibacter soli]|uniref:Uncharacterized protein n=1 Tax=Deminuibacter soli TaxID=2291815 RepID=A0A3E1NG48_9BACT|nr:hypothetical protein DXN05_17585 [Deminuibacter soli]
MANKCRNKWAGGKGQCAADNLISSSLAIMLL